MPTSHADNPVADENRLAGSLDWQLLHTQFDDPETLRGHPLIRRLRSSAIEGYASKPSVYPGETLDLMVSMAPAGSFTVDFYRMGYYGGCGGRHMAHIGAFRAEPEGVPMMTMERLRECDWPVSATFTIPQDWGSGVYLGKLRRDESYGAESYVIFVVKERRKVDVLCQVSDMTWQAYNKWPGRDSLYDDGTPNVWYTGPNVRVSFDRPYAKYCQILDAPLSAGSGEYLLWEHPMTFWLEEQGYDVAYCSNFDVHLDPTILDRCSVFLSVAHDEYWTRDMFEAVLNARDDGMSIAFLSGNSVYEEITMYDSGVTGTPCRAYARKGRIADADQLMGLSSYGSACGDWVVTDAAHWVYEGTGLRDGSRIPGLIGWEYHGTPADIPGIEVVAQSGLYPQPDNPEYTHSAVVFPCAKGNMVFNAGTIWWPEGLACPPGHIPARTGRSGPQGVHPAVQAITSNVLDRMIRESPRR